eukprot:TRINITY_DN8495_c0_g1_i1.p1 TRINITY_DN8495_c0_g1~~TRINITY_DN8495_c0_g1_i1.p1  ORF type:complete len:1230 (-),score=298.63 TRINITY_DN8495_c0_g1_i1:2365-5892(-)
MESFNSTVLGKTQLFCVFSALKPTTPPENRFRINPSCNQRNRFHFILKNSFSSSSSTCRKLQISSRLGRTSKRQNSLRKKLFDEAKVRKNPDSSNPFPNLNNSNHVYDENEKPQIDSNFVNTEESDLSGIVYDNMENSSIEKLDELGDTFLWSKLENWADQYKKDSEDWGVGSGPIFTIYQDLRGNVSRVSVNKDEILKRSGVEPGSFKSLEVGEDTMDLNSKISRANLIAREIESGEYRFPKNSSIATFVVDKQTSFFDGFHSAALRGDSLSKLPWIGFTMLCGCFIFWATKKLFVGRKNEVKLTREEEEMLRRKLRSRMEKAKVESGNVEVVVNDLALKRPVGPIERPHLDKDELMKIISRAKGVNENPTIFDSSVNVVAKEKNLSDKIMEIQEMARQAREIEREKLSKLDKNGEEIDLPVVSDAIKEEICSLESDADKKTVAGVKASDSVDRVKSLFSLESGESLGNNQVTEAISLDNTVKEDVLSEPSASCDAENSISQSNTRTSNFEVGKNDLKVVKDPSRMELTRMHSSYADEEIRSHELSYSKPSSTSKSAVSTKQRIITSVEEAKDYLSQKGGPQGDPHVRSLANDKEAKGREDRAINDKDGAFKPSNFDKALDLKFVTGASEDSALATDFSDERGRPLAPSMSGSSDSLEPCSTMNPPFIHTDGIDKKPLDANKSWIEENFQEFEPIVKKIRAGFQENYMVAKENVQEQSSLSAEVNQLGFKEDDELEWMKDDGLRKIVFKVRENELAGRDPFHLMDAEDKNAFFKGLERKIEIANEKLLGVHEYVHSRIENLDYGSDGISLHDPPEKIIPRWKGPTFDKDSEFLKNFVEHKNATLKENLGMSSSANQHQDYSIQKREEPASSPISPSYGVHNLTKKRKDEASRDPKTVIESSDGSTRPGKKSGKEHWQHTKKWTREFLEVYNAETDPEIKSIMKDMGKDLDRWITEKEVKEAVDLMTRIPKRKRRYIEKKMEKLKREMEMFGPHAVVSKYKEYSEEKEEDYLWWLDLPYILCIELYIKGDDIERVGFYSLEMAVDLELDPKQYHVVAFEDPRDCKSFCYILQAHMEMLGNGCAFVVARPPKDTFREAKGNGFSVTVIRKGEIQLNVDQTLEEVENEITEIGSKMYHDKIMRERSVDMSGLMKGVFGAGKTTKRRSKRMLTMPTKR